MGRERERETGKGKINRGGGIMLFLAIPPSHAPPEYLGRMGVEDHTWDDLVDFVSSYHTIVGGILLEVSSKFY